jgi:hypothetical protein
VLFALVRLNELELGEHVREVDDVVPLLGHGTL